MLKLRKRSLVLKISLVFAFVVGALLFAGLIAVHQLRMNLLRDTARAVADQVFAFRGWIARSGVVWVGKLTMSSEDYLDEIRCGASTFYSKNPALATRELSTIVEQSSGRAKFRVVSNNYRNPRNAPNAFETEAILRFKKELMRPREQQERFVDVIDGNTYSYAVPILVEAPCLRCHGDSRAAPAAVVRKYGDKRGFGYKVGDVRGILTVELPAMTLLEMSPATNAASVLLAALSLLAAFFLLKTMLIDRIRSVTDAAERIARGDVAAPPTACDPESRDELDLLSASLERIRTGSAAGRKKAEGTERP